MRERRDKQVAERMPVTQHISTNEFQLLADLYCIHARDRQTLRSNRRKMPVSLQLETPTPPERHYAVAEIAEAWNLSADKVRALFEYEPGVLVITDQIPRRKRRYRTLRIPQSVVDRVHTRLSMKSAAR